MNTKKKPTLDMYQFVQIAYDWFNERLFNNQLGACIFTFQREKNTMGYYSRGRWQGEEQKIDEIALNPNYFITHNPLEFMQTLVHEMCHKWQYDHGTPSRRTYHNKEWAEKMESIGLIPSDTGRIGGRKTGQQMADYPQKDGLFEIACIMLANGGYKLPYVDAYTGSKLKLENDLQLDSPFAQQFEIALGNSNLVTAMAQNPLTKQTRVKYSCPICKTNIWAKPNINVICGDCEENFIGNFEN